MKTISVLLLLEVLIVHVYNFSYFLPLLSVTDDQLVIPDQVCVIPLQVQPLPEVSIAGAGYQVLLVIILRTGTLVHIGCEVCPPFKVHLYCSQHMRA